MDSTADSGDSNNVRRRITRACDQCNAARTKCDGKQPCAHCREVGVQCDYIRAHKKRGRAPKKDQESPPDEAGFVDNNVVAESSRPQPLARKYSSTSYVGSTVPDTSTAPNNGTFDVLPNPYYNGYNSHVSLNNTSNIHEAMVPGLAQQNFSTVPNPASYSSQGIDNVQQGFGFPLGDDYSVAFMAKAPIVESPDWMALTTPMFIPDGPLIPSHPLPSDSLRYPVLRPLLPHIEMIMPLTLACDLLEQYFASSTSAYLRPSNPYVLGHIFRKKSVLHPVEPRPCTPALLASMLWISAQTSDAAFLTSQLDARGKVCQKLLELIIQMLKPLIHSSSGMVIGTYNPVAQSDAGLSGLVVPTDHTGTNNLGRVQIDNLVTYIHLATVVSASERKAASLRWWNAAWSLARELRLGRELSDEAVDGQNGSAEEHQIGSEARKQSFGDQQHPGTSLRTAVTEEEREERRRAWWLLYMQDRHLALCYNRPMFFLNKECEELLQPLDDDIWQSERFESAASAYRSRSRGLNIKCTSHSVFGFFLPLMVCLGEILDLNHNRNRPRFGPRATRPRNWDDSIDEITQQLEIYGSSLREFEAAQEQMGDRSLNDAVTPSVASGSAADAQSSAEWILQTKTVVAYGTHIMHVLHILLTGKWDPIAMLDDNDLWISSQSFVSATGHAVNAAEAVGEVIEFDPDLSFMPFFFGVYLLQGSFLLLLFADKLQGDVSQEVVKACETIVRAHEAMISTLETTYQVSKYFVAKRSPANVFQRNFRKVMRSALQQVRGRVRDDATEQQNWRREILKLYRWTGDGTGLAL